MSRLLTIDNRVVAADVASGAKRLQHLTPGQTPAQCVCCGSAPGDPCCTGLVNCFIKDNITIPWSATFSSSWFIFETGDKFSYQDSVSSQKSTVGGSPWCNAACVKGVHDVLGQWPDKTASFGLLTQTKDQQCPIDNVGAGSDCIGGGFFAYPLRHMAFDFSPPANNKAPAFGVSATMLQGGQTVYGWGSKHDPDPIECVTTAIGDWGDGCKQLFDFSWYHKHVYRNLLTKQPEWIKEYSVQVQFQIDWTSCGSGGTGEKPTPPPPPPASGCKGCGKKTYTAI